MDTLRLFSVSAARNRVLPVRRFPTEVELRRFVVRHAQAMIGTTMLATEFVLAANEGGGGRIDALGVDTRNCPVIIEFKKEASGCAICQGLSYLDWLLSHREVFTELAREQLGSMQAERMRWSDVRLMCIAQEITGREEAVARQIGRPVELLRIQRLSRSLVSVQQVPIPSG